MMCLSDEITFNITLPNPRPLSRMYKYELYRKDETLTSGEELIFVGNFYYSDDRAYDKSLILSDIVRSLKTAPDTSLIESIDVKQSTDIALISLFRVKVYFTSTPTVTGWKQIAMLYEYKNYNRYLDRQDITPGSFQGIYAASLQGRAYSSNAYLLVPHYPLLDTYIYPFVQSFNVNTLNYPQQITLTLTNDTRSTVSFNTGTKKEGTMVVCSIGELFGDYQSTSDKLVKDADGVTIAVFDSCYKRYYLLWQDRYGGFQSQPFSDTLTYSESFDVTEVKNYREERKYISIQVQPKWKLTSGWIAEDTYPFYESIFVSPVLYLYDSQENQMYKVITKGSYTEKKYKNDKKLLSLSLDLESTSTQSITY